jgi:hypothetical protein
MSTLPKGAQGEAAPQDVRDAITALLAAHGEAATVDRLGVDRQTFARVLAGLPVRRGTLALVRESLAKTESP